MLHFALALLLPLQADGPEAPTLNAANFDSIVEYVVPDEDELKWRAIPWRSTLLEGLHGGADEHKPVLLWAMNGHPLGTT